MLFMSNINNVLPFVDLHWASCLHTRKHVTIFQKWCKVIVDALSNIRVVGEWLARPGYGHSVSPNLG